VAVAASYDDSLRYGAQTPFSDQLAFQLEGGSWQVDANHNSIIAAGNGGSKPVQARLTFFYAGGAKRYQLERTIAPDDQMWVNVGDLIRNSIPDKNGNTLPSDLTTGAYQLLDLADAPAPALYEGKVVTDKTFGHATYGCMICCGYRGVSFNPDPFDTYVSGASSVNAIGYNACGSGTSVVNGYMTTWWSGNSSIMSVSPHSATGVSIGSTSINADAPNFPERGILDGMTCPVQDTQDTGTGNVAPTLSLSNALFYNGGLPLPSTFTESQTSTVITASGASGGSYEWSLSSPSGAIASFSSSSSVTTTTTTSNTVTIYAAGPSKNIDDLTITLNWTPSGGSPLTSTTTASVDSPYSLSLIAQTPLGGAQTCNPLATGSLGWYTKYTWQMNSYFRNPLLGMSVNENFTNISISIQPGYGYTANGTAGLSGIATFTDTYCASFSDDGAITTKPPQNPPLSTVVDSATQTYRLGSTAVESGTVVQTQTLTRYPDHITVTNIAQ
jgi:hypothetical protein